jgi:hypothetical protein
MGVYSSLRHSLPGCESSRKEWKRRNEFRAPMGLKGMDRKPSTLYVFFSS